MLVEEAEEVYTGPDPLIQWLKAKQRISFNKSRQGYLVSMMDGWCLPAGISVIRADTEAFNDPVLQPKLAKFKSMGACISHIRRYGIDPGSKTPETLILD